MNAAALLWAVRYALRGRGARAGAIAAAWGLAVASLLLLISLASSLRSHTEQQFDALGARSASVRLAVPRGQEQAGEERLQAADARALAALPGVAHSAAALPLPAQHARDARGELLQVRALAAEPDYAAITGLKLAAGRTLDWTDEHHRRQTCVVGSELALRLDASSALGEHLRIGEHWCRVVGIAEPRGELFGVPQDTLVWLPLSLALEHRQGDPALMLLLGMHDSQALATRLDSVRDALVARHGTALEDEERLRIDSAAALRDSLDGVSKALRLLLLSFGLILFCVAGFGVTALTLAAIAERIREIGVHKALGASRGALLQQMLTEASVVSGSGIAAGGLAALLLCGLLSHALPFLPSLALSPLLVIGVCAGALLIALAAAVVPAARGAGMDPIEALREVRG